MLDLKYDILCLTYTVNATLKLNRDLFQQIWNFWAVTDSVWKLL